MIRFRWSIYHKHCQAVIVHTACIWIQLSYPKSNILRIFTIIYFFWRCKSICETRTVSMLRVSTLAGRISYISAEKCGSHQYCNVLRLINILHNSYGRINYKQVKDNDNQNKLSTQLQSPCINTIYRLTLHH